MKRLLFPLVFVIIMLPTQAQGAVCADLSVSVPVVCEATDQVPTPALPKIIRDTMQEPLSPQPLLPSGARTLGPPAPTNNSTPPPKATPRQPAPDSVRVPVTPQQRSADNKTVTTLTEEPCEIVVVEGRGDTIEIGYTTATVAGIATIVALLSFLIFYRKRT